MWHDSSGSMSLHLICQDVPTCCIMTVLSPSKVTSTSMSFLRGPMRLAARKPCPPQHSLHACSVSTRLQVAPAFSPEEMTWMAFASAADFWLTCKPCTFPAPHQPFRKTAPVAAQLTARPYQACHMGWGMTDGARPDQAGKAHQGGILNPTLTICRYQTEAP